MNHTQTLIKQRRLYMALPVLTTPFLVMIFWALGGGTNATPRVADVVNSGLVTTLPEPHLEGKEQWDKLSLYDQAQSDSMRYEEARENDPYFDLVAFKTSRPVSESQGDNKLINEFPQRDRQNFDQVERNVQEKLSQLQHVIRGSENVMPVKQSNKPANVDYLPMVANDNSASSELASMEQMMQMLGERNRQPDPEMQQIDGVLEKILDIQHPERVKERRAAVEERSNAQAFRIERTVGDEITLLNPTNNSDETNATNNVSFSALVDSLGDKTTPVPMYYSQNGFFGLVDHHLVTTGNLANIQAHTAINAVIHDTQELVTGSTVRMRLTEEITISGISLPKDQFIYGTCEINGERLTIKVNSIRMDDILLPVALSTYDLDGLEGVHIPGAITRDAAKQGASDGLQSMQMMTMNPTIGAQAASAGIEAAKGLLSKKARLVKVTVKAGYQVLLQDSGTSM